MPIVRALGILSLRSFHNLRGQGASPGPGCSDPVGYHHHLQVVYVPSQAGYIAGAEVPVYDIPVVHAVLAESQLGREVEKLAEVPPSAEAVRAQHGPPGSPPLAARYERGILLGSEPPQGYFFP